MVPTLRLLALRHLQGSVAAHYAARMLARVRRRFTRQVAMTPLDTHWELNHRVEHLYQLNEELSRRLGDEMAAAAAGYLADFQRRAAVLEHTLAEVQASIAVAAEAMLLAAREHAEAASAAAAAAVAAAAREHTEASVESAVRESVIASQEHAEAATAEALAAALSIVDERVGALRADTEEQLAILRRRIDHARLAAAPAL